ncbi:MAG: asparaginase domain-containing protein [Pseudomonadota bacterium]
MLAIQIFSVGGTIDKIYFDAKSEYEIGVPAVEAVLKEMNSNLDVSVVSLMAKDSLEMTAADRTLIGQAVLDCDRKHIVITHGTDTMTETAEYLLTLPELQDKTIVLTGALAPAIFKASDAEFNLGGALIAAQTAVSGVYIVMQGEIFAASKVKKDRKLNRFIRVS